MQVGPFTAVIKRPMFIKQAGIYSSQASPYQNPNSNTQTLYSIHRHLLEPGQATRPTLLLSGTPSIDFFGGHLWSHPSWCAGDSITGHASAYWRIRDVVRAEFFYDSGGTDIKDPSCRLGVYARRSTRPRAFKHRCAHPSPKHL